MRPALHVAEGAMVAVDLAGEVSRLPVRVRPDLPSGVAGMVVGLSRVDRQSLARLGKVDRRSPARLPARTAIMSELASGIANAFGILIVLVGFAAYLTGSSGGCSAFSRTATGRTGSVRSASFRLSPT